MRAGRATAACVLAALVALAPAGASAGGGDTGSTGATYSVGMRLLDLVDEERETPADAAAQQGPIGASAARALPTTVFYPAAGAAPTDPGADPLLDADPRRGRFPVILFSHGAPGAPHDYRSLLVRWASQGYVVVAPQYPITSTAGPTEVAWADARDQVRDARHVLSEVLALDRVAWSEDGLGGHLDRRHVAAAGHSMGGLTTLALVSECCRDRRVDAAVVLAGVSQGKAGPRIEHPRGPILFAHAMLDVAVSIRSSERAFRRASAPKYLLEIRVPVGGVVAHLLPFSGGTGRISSDVAAVIDDFLAAYLQDEDEAAARLAPPANPGEDLRLRGDP